MGMVGIRLEIWAMHHDPPNIHRIVIVSFLVRRFRFAGELDESGAETPNKIAVPGSFGGSRKPSSNLHPLSPHLHYDASR
jgi:hypothetical protein